MIHPSHVFPDWAPKGHTPFRERRCTGCGMQQEEGPLHRAHDADLRHPCGWVPEPFEGDACFIGPVGWGDPEREGRVHRVRGSNGTGVRRLDHVSELGSGGRGVRRGAGGHTPE